MKISIPLALVSPWTIYSMISEQNWSVFKNNWQKIDRKHALFCPDFFSLTLNISALSWLSKKLLRLLESWDNEVSKTVRLFEFWPILRGFIFSWSPFPLTTFKKNFLQQSCSSRYENGNFYLIFILKPPAPPQTNEILYKSKLARIIQIRVSQKHIRIRKSNSDKPGLG